MTDSTIEMSQRLRVKINPQYKEIYNALKNVAVGDFHELFFLCVCLGKKNGKSLPLEKGEDRFWSSTIIPDEWYSYYGIYLHDHNMELSCLKNDVDVINTMQDYANAGMKILIDEFLHDSVKKDATGKYIVDSTTDLPKELLAKVVMDWS